ncbi:MAG: hypothetical protein ACI9SG_002810 [Maribacter sp.]
MIAREISILPVGEYTILWHGSILLPTYKKQVCSFYNKKWTRNPK